MSSTRTFTIPFLAALVALVALALCAASAAAQQALTALARVDAAQSSITETANGGVELRLTLSQPVPFRVFTLDDPWRLVLDFSEVDWSGLPMDGLTSADVVDRAASGRFRPGWSRLVMTLAAPLRVAEAGMATRGSDGARVLLRLVPSDAAAFRAAAGMPDDAQFRLPAPVTDLPVARPRQRGDRALVVVLDPGHGGIDPGAEREGVDEAALMLSFARELRDVLIRAGGFEVRLTRDDDIFVPLELRQSIARAAGADVFLSLHADALAEGRASGATIYTLSETASDVASKLLAERHDRGDLLAGLDLSRQDDVIAEVLMDLARAETAPRSDRLAGALVEGLSKSIGNLHKRPRLSANFSVLKAPDIPSVLIELGFMSSPRDLELLRDAEWRARAAAGIRDALQSWAAADAAEAALVRR